MGMFDHVLIEGHELPGIDPERLERAHRTDKQGGQEDLAGLPARSSRRRIWRTAWGPTL